MKTIFVILFGVIISIFSFGQESEKKEIIKINYATTFATPSLIQLMKLQIPDPEKLNEIINLINQYQIFYSLKYFKDNGISTYEIDSIKQADQVQIPGFVKSGYKQADGGFYNTESFMNSEYTIKDNSLNYDWKIKGDTLNINGYTCYEAYSDKLPRTKVWFTPDILIKTGPSIYYGLPGLVLKYENNFEETIATNITTISTSVDLENKANEILKTSINSKNIKNIKEVIQSKESFMKLIENKINDNSK